MERYVLSTEEPTENAEASPPDLSELEQRQADTVRGEEIVAGFPVPQTADEHLEHTRLVRTYVDAQASNRSRHRGLRQTEDT